MNNNRNGNLGCTWTIAIVFVILKLTHVIDWSWLWVLAPLWIPIGLLLIIVFMAIVMEELK